MGDAPFRLIFALKVTHLFVKRRLGQISAYNLSTVRVLLRDRLIAKKFNYDE